MRWPLPWPRSWRREKGDEPAPLEEEKPKSLRQSLILFARDLGIAFLIVAIAMAAVFAYTGVWPPMVVVESDSMQHSETASFLGVIDTGDLVLVQDVQRASDVVTYVEGRAKGYETYSTFGDVIIFIKPGDEDRPTSTPIIHRAIVYVERNSSGGVDVPSLTGQSGWRGETVDGEVATSPLALRNLTIDRVQTWPRSGSGATLKDLSYTNLDRSGFLTKGDHNDQPDLSWGPVGVANVLGRARGELPWFGLLKLTLAPGTSGCCDGWGDPEAPQNSWDALLLSLVLIIVGPFAADFGWGYFAAWRKKRRAPPVPPGEDTIVRPAEPAAPLAPSSLPEQPPPEAPLEPPPAVEPEGVEADTVTGEARTKSVGPGAGVP